MTRKEAISDNRYELIKKYKQKLIEATNIESREDEMKVIDNILFRFWQIGWLDRLEGVCFDEWCDDCKEYDTKKKCCPRFNRVIRGAMNREPSEDGTLEVKVEDATKIGRVLISDDEHRGGLYYPDEDEPKGDLISRAEAIEAMGEEPPVWCDEEYEIAERDQWRADIEAIKSVPSADRPRPIEPTITVDLESGVVPISACEPKEPKTIVYADRVYAERPKGKWVDADGKEVMTNKWGKSMITLDSAWCSECGEWLVASDEYPARACFCPNCGADMRPTERSEE